jgi:hypothetical protein
MQTCIHTWLCVHTHAHIHMITGLHAWFHACKRACTHDRYMSLISECFHMYLRVHIHTYSLHTYIHTCIYCICFHTNIFRLHTGRHTPACICMCVCVCVCGYVFMHSWVCMQTCTYIHTCMHTHIHNSNMYTCTQKKRTYACIGKKTHINTNTIAFKPFCMQTCTPIHKKKDISS